jgi:hypothetical protein
MRPVSLRTQLWSIAFGYAAALVVAAALLFANYLKELNHSVDVSSGMYAGGQFITDIIIAFLLTIPTLFQVRVVERYEVSATVYSQLLVGISLSAPVCLGLVRIGETHVSQSLLVLSLYRLVSSPFVLVGIGFSRVVARFDQAKKLASYALVIEGLTLAIAVTLVVRH